MRTVDPLGRHEECDRIVDAVRHGSHVIVVGHPVLGSDAARRRVRSTLAPHTRPIDLDAPAHDEVAIASMRELRRDGTLLHGLVTEHGTRVVLHLDDAIDPSVPVEVPKAISHEPVTIVRLPRLGRRRLDRLVDDRLARRGIEPSWLGRTDRALIHSLSAGYPLLAAALVDDRIAPGRAARAPGAAAAILRALPPRVRRAAAVLSTLGGIAETRASRHLGDDPIDALERFGLASDTSDGMRVGPLFRDRLSSRAAAPSREAARAIDEIVHSWRRSTTTTSELVLAARAIDRGVVRPSAETSATIAAIAAVAVLARSGGGDASELASTARRLDRTLLPHLTSALVAGDDGPFDALLRDAVERGHDPLVSRVGDELLRSMVLMPSGGAMSPEGIEVLAEDSGVRGLAEQLVDLGRARVALDAGRHDVVVAACESVIASDADDLVAVRAHGMLAVAAGALGRMSVLMASMSALRAHVSDTIRWTPVAIAVTTRAIAQVRATASSIGLPTMTVLDDALDRLVALAAASDDFSSIAYASVAELASRPTPEMAQVARRTIAQLPDLPVRGDAIGAAEVFELAAAGGDRVVAPSQHAWTAPLGIGAAMLVGLEQRDAASLLEDCEAHLAVGVHSTATLRLVRAHLRTALGLPHDLDDLQDLSPGELPPLLRALLWHAQGVRARDARLVADAAALVVAARHRRLARTLIDAADRLGADPESIARLHNRLAASVTASTKRLRANRQWIDRDAAGLAAAGLTDLQIADLVGVPLGTVRTRSRAIMADLGLPAREHLREQRDGIVS